MRILFITDNFPPESNAPAARTYDHCRQWVRKGAEVTVITCAPNFPQGIVYEGYRNLPVQTEMVDGIRVVRVWSYTTRNEGFLKRTLDFISFSVAAFLVGLFQKTDVIIATSPQFFTTWTAFGLSRLKCKPWIFELRDIWPEQIRAVGAIKYNWVIDFLEKIELGLYRDCARVVALTPAFKKNLVSRGIDGAKIDIVPNGADLELFMPRGKDPDVVRRLGLEGAFVVAYIGTHGLSQKLSSIVSGLKRFETSLPSHVKFLFIGDGAEKKLIVDLAAKEGLKNLVMCNPVPKEDVPAYLSVADVSLIPLHKTELFKKVIPSKIFEAAAMRKPILLGVDGQAREIIEKHDAGLFFEPENMEDMLEKLLLLIRDKELYARLQMGCAKLAEAYDRVELASSMLDIVAATARARG